MTLKLGTADVTKVYVGAIEAQKLYLGNVEVWSESSPPAELSPTDRDAVDAIVLAAMDYPVNPVATGTGVTGCIIGISGPLGYYEQAYGLTTGSHKRDLTVADHFRMGSVTKTFTATAFWMALDRGEVALSDTLDMYVPGVPNGDIITMEHILTMRSGVYNYTSNLAVLLKILLSPAGPYSEADALDLIKSNPSQFTPGSSYAYNNSNAILIGAVVEAVTGRNIRTVLQEDVFTPLGMTETQWPASVNIPLPAAATGKFNPELAGAAGALTTTIGDFTKWAKALRDGTLISSGTWNTWTTTFPNTGLAIGALGTPPPTSFSYGHFLMTAGTWIGHDGSVSGFGSGLAFDSVSGATITVSVNKQVSTAFFGILRNIAAYLYPDSVLDP